MRVERVLEPKRKIGAMLGLVSAAILIANGCDGLLGVDFDDARLGEAGAASPNVQDAAGDAPASVDGGGVDVFADVTILDSGESGCNAVVQQGTSVNLVAASGSPPTSTGGSFVPGTYVLVTAKAYGSGQPDGKDLRDFGRSTIVVVDKSLEGVHQDNDGTTRYNASVSGSSNQLVLSPTCISAPNKENVLPLGKMNYTAGTTTFRLYVDVDSYLVEVVYQRK